MFRPIGSLLGDAVGRLKVRKPLEATIICRAVDDALAAQWQHAVPMRAIRYRDGVATIAVISPAWGHEVSTRGESIKERANKKLGGAVVSRVTTRVSPRLARGEREE